MLAGEKNSIEFKHRTILIMRLSHEAGKEEPAWIVTIWTVLPCWTVYLSKGTHFKGHLNVTVKMLTCVTEACFAAG